MGLFDEIKRVRLQTLARALSNTDDLALKLGNRSNTDIQKKYVCMMKLENEIEPGVLATQAECWIALKALTAHEAAHVRYSDNNAWQEAQKEGLTYLVNIIEDARVEKAISNVFPGTTAWLRYFNNYIYQNRKNWETGPAALYNAIKCYTIIGKVPSSLKKQEDVMEHLAMVSDLLDQARNASDTWSVLDASKNIWKYIKDYMSAYIPKETLPAKMGTDSPEKNPGGEIDPRQKPEPIKVKKPSRKKPDEPETEDSEDKSDKAKNEELETRPEGKSEKIESNDKSDVKSKDDSETEPEEPETELETETKDESEDKHDKLVEMEDKSEAEPETEPKAETKNDTKDEHETEINEPEDKTETRLAEPENEPETNSEEESKDKSEAKPEIEDDIEEENNLEKDVLEDEQENDLIKDEPEDSIETSIKIEATDNFEDFDQGPDDSYSELLSHAEEELEDMAILEKATEASPPEHPPDIDPKEIETGVSTGIHKNVHLVFLPGSLSEEKARTWYEKTKQAIWLLLKKTMEEIRKALLYKTAVREYTKSKGRIHGGSLWKLNVFDPHVFYSVSQPSDNPKLIIYLLVDCSGSMSSNRKMKKAKEATILLHEACKELKIGHIVTGFTSSGDGDVYHIPAIKYAEYEKSYQIAWLEYLYQNRDGYSIRIATRELLSIPGPETKILIVLSDGTPHDPYNRYVFHGAVIDTARSVREAEKMGINVIGIYFGDEIDLPSAQKMYNNLIFIKELEHLPPIIGRVLKRITVG